MTTTLTPSTRLARRFLFASALTVAIVAATAGAARAQAPAAAQGLDAILSQLATYDGGIESAAVWHLHEYVDARRNDPSGLAECETKLLAFLGGTATRPARAVATRYLRVIAGAGAVPALEAMLADERSADAALYVLQPMPGTAAEAALIRALGTAPGAAKTAVIAALGERRQTDAVPGLAGLLRQPAYAAAAATSLGRIGGDAAAAELSSAFASATGELKTVVAASMLTCAERGLAAGNRPAAALLYEKVLNGLAAPLLPARADQVPPATAATAQSSRTAWSSAPLRRAAAMGKIAASGDNAETVLVDMLRNGDRVVQEAAIAKIRDVFPPDAIKPVCDAMPALPDDLKLQVLPVLQHYPAQRIVAVVMQQMSSGTDPVRAAAIRVYATFAGESEGAAEFLARTAARTRGVEQAAARAALGALKGRTVDADIVALLGQKPADDLANELLLGVAERRVFLARSAVVGLLASPARSVRAQALKTLRVIGTPSDVAPVLDFLLATDDDGERVAAENAIGALTAKVGNPDARARLVRARLTPKLAPAGRVRVIGAFPVIGDNSVLPAVRAALDDPDADVVDAAVRALAAWPTPAVRGDLRRLARTSVVETHRLLALQGLVRVIGLEPYRSPEDGVADLAEALGLATRPEERKLVLGALPTFACGAALDLATKLVQDPEVQAEAQAAVERITARRASPRNR
jgi:HEAT repeat protein